MSSGDRLRNCRRNSKNSIPKKVETQSPRPSNNSKGPSEHKKTIMNYSDYC